MCAGPADRGARHPRLPGVGAGHLQREPGGQRPLRVPGHSATCDMLTTEAPHCHCSNCSMCICVWHEDIIIIIVISRSTPIPCRSWWPGCPLQVGCRSPSFLLIKFWRILVGKINIIKHIVLFSSIKRLNKFPLVRAAAANFKFIFCYKNYISSGHSIHYSFWVPLEYFVYNICLFSQSGHNLDQLIINAAGPAKGLSTQIFLADKIA